MASDTQLKFKQTVYVRLNTTALPFYVTPERQVISNIWKHRV